jgi:cytochrome P450
VGKPADDFDPWEPEDFDTAHRRYRELRRRCPVAYSSRWGGFWAAFRYQDVVRVVSDHRTFTTTVQNVVPRVAFTGRRPPLHLDPPEHTPYRVAIDRSMGPRRVEALEPTIRRCVGDLLRPLLAYGSGDVAGEVAQRLPGRVLAHFFHLPPDTAREVEETTRVYHRAVQAADDDRVRASSAVLYRIARDLVQVREREPLDPSEDVVSALLSARGSDGSPLPRDGVVGAVRQLLVTGMIAPSVFVGSMVVHLAREPELHEWLRSKPGETPAAVEELLRLYTPYRGFARTPRHPVVVGGRRIDRGEAIALVFVSANRDEAVFAEPDRFVLGRPNIKQHLAFGRGPHRCPGAGIARAMLRIFLEEWTDRVERVLVDGPVRMTGWPEWGTNEVRVRVHLRR